MDSSHAKETKAHDDGADQTSQTGAQQLSQSSENISGSLGNFKRNRNLYLYIFMLLSFVFVQIDYVTFLSYLKPL